MYSNTYNEKNKDSSLIINIKNILNTRSSYSLSQFLSADISKLTTIHFGLPSFTHLTMDSSYDRKLLCEIVEKSIQAFEHRLSCVDVEFSHFDSLKKEAKLSLYAVYQNDDIQVKLILKMAFWEFMVYE